MQSSTLLILLVHATRMCAPASENVTLQALRGSSLQPPPAPIPTMGPPEVVDISWNTKVHFEEALKVVQHSGVECCEVLTLLDQCTGDMILKVENATGSPIHWSRTLAEVPGGRALSGRRRVSWESLVKRSRFIDDILLHLGKEMEILWKYFTQVERKRVAVGSLIASSPYGPHGEHPSRWRPQQIFPISEQLAQKNLTELLMASDSGPMAVTVNAAEMSSENVLAKQLQQSYVLLVADLNNLGQHIRALRQRLVKMSSSAESFIGNPSGVWHRIDANEDP